MSVAPGSVWLDARGTQSALHGERGIARFVAGHTRALARLYPELIGAIGLDPAASIPPSLEPLAGSDLFAWHRRTRPPQGRVPGIYHVMSPFEMTINFDDIWPAWLRRSNARLVVTLHDLIPLIMYEDYVRAWGSFGTVWMARLGLIRSADHVVTNSENTARDAIERLGIPKERVTPIHSGVSGDHASLVASRDEAEAILRDTLPRIRPGFLLYVGGDDKRKNLDGILRAYAQLPERLRSAHQLVIAFRVGPLRKFEIRVMARPLGIRARDLVLTGFVTDRQLAALYRACVLFVFPSLYEGAGLPVLEAMSCGAPVAASNTTSIPELLGDPEGTFDPSDPVEIARAVTDVLETPGKLESLRERSRRRVALYTWDRVARETIPAYERAMELPVRGRLRRSQRPGQKRVAVVTPWSADSTGIGEYSRGLVSALAGRAEVEVVVQDAEANAAQLNGGARVLTEAQFDWRRELPGFDRCLYILGASADHLHALEATLKAPGVVLAHDVHLLPLYAEMHALRHPYDPYWLEDRLIEMYGDRMSRADLLRVPYDRPEQGRGLYMTREIQAHADRVLVHSQRHAGILRLERPDDAAPVDVVPRAIPETPSPAFARSDEGSPVVVKSDSDAGGAVWSAISDAIAARVPVVAVGSGWSEELPENVVLPLSRDCTSHELVERIEAASRDHALRAEVREAQDAYAAEHSFARVAERYADLLNL
jgi:glycosyltransferase involved in cell wall biosynthesis